MTDKDIINILKDEFGTYDTMVFCQLYSRFCELADFINSEDKEFDIEYYKKQAKELENQIQRI